MGVAGGTSVPFSWAFPAPYGNPTPEKRGCLLLATEAGKPTAVGGG